MWKFKGKRIPKPKTIKYNFHGSMTPTGTADGWYKIMLRADGEWKKRYGTLPIEISETRYKRLTDALDAINNKSFNINKDYISFINSHHVSLHGESELIIVQCEEGYYIALAISSNTDLCNRVSVDMFLTEESAEEHLLSGDWVYTNNIGTSRHYNDNTRIQIYAKEGQYHLGRRSGNKPDYGLNVIDFEDWASANAELERHLNDVY